jgi:glycosyltransferase involved in cell wall biosynthesis
MKPLRVAICADFPEEQWPSMDRVASMLLDGLDRSHAGAIDASMVRPPFARRLTRVPLVGLARAAFSGDRFINRFWRYPRALERLRDQYDVFHIVDHSYAHLAHVLPADRTVVTCHDLDAFRSILQPEREPRSSAFQTMTRDILGGLQRAARVTCDTAAVRDELVGRGLVPADRVIIAPLGVSRIFSPTPDPACDLEAAALLQSPPGAIEILHVGSTVPRKRIDLLLRVCAAVGHDFPDLRVVRVGDPLTPEQRRLASDAGLAGRLVAVNGVDEPILAALYRRAALVLLPSDREGFGLPLVEAMASGTPVVASDLPVLREVGGSAAEYCAAGDVDAWQAKVIALVGERRDNPTRWEQRKDAGCLRASRFTWPRFAASMANVYASLSGGASLSGERDRGDERRRSAESLALPGDSQAKVARAFQASDMR